MSTDSTIEHGKISDGDATDKLGQSRLRRVVDMTNLSQNRGKKSKNTSTHHEGSKTARKTGKKKRAKSYPNTKNNRDAQNTNRSQQKNPQAAPKTQANNEARPTKDADKTQNLAPNTRQNKRDNRRNQNSPKTEQFTRKRSESESLERRKDDNSQSYSPRTTSSQKNIKTVVDDKRRTVAQKNDENQTPNKAQNQTQRRGLAPLPRAKKQKFAQGKAIKAKRQGKVLNNEARARAAIERHSSGRRATRKVQRASLKSDAQNRRLSSSQSANKIIDALLLQSWRAKEWIESVANINKDMGEKLEQSILLVQAKLVSKIEITNGRATAEVVNRNVSVDLKQFSLGQWRGVISMLSDRAIYTTSLLNGKLPAGIVDVFKQGSVSLFPQRSRDFSYQCDCPQTKAPCEHACAVLLSIAQALEEDPFKLLLLRGITRDDLLAQLRGARSDQVVDEKTRYRISFEIPAQNLDFNAFYVPKGDFNEFTFHIAHAKNSLLKRLGNPEPWDGGIPVHKCIGEVMDLAAKRAEIVGLCEKPSEDCLERPQKTSKAALSRAPKNSNKARFEMPDLRFVLESVPENIRDTIVGDPVQTAEDIIRWLKTRGAADMRTLARRTRLHKPTIQAFLEAFCEKNLVRQEGNDDHAKYVANF